jgi:hypothetical protein
MFVCDALIHLHLDVTLTMDHSWKKDNEIAVQASQESMTF